MSFRRIVFSCTIAAALPACGAPPGYSGDPPGVDHSTVKQGCLHQAWAYPKPQNEAVWIDCLTNAGYTPEPETVKRREELRQMGY